MTKVKAVAVALLMSTTSSIAFEVANPGGSSSSSVQEQTAKKQQDKKQGSSQGSNQGSSRTASTSVSHENTNLFFPRKDENNNLWHGDFSAGFGSVDLTTPFELGSAYGSAFDPGSIISLEARGHKVGANNIVTKVEGNWDFSLGGSESYDYNNVKPDEYNSWSLAAGLGYAFGSEDLVIVPGAEVRYTSTSITNHGCTDYSYYSSYSNTDCGTIYAFDGEQESVSASSKEVEVSPTLDVRYKNVFAGINGDSTRVGVAFNKWSVAVESKETDLDNGLSTDLTMLKFGFRY